MSDSFKLLKDYVESLTKDCSTYPEVVEKAINTIVGDEIPKKLKIAIALSELITFSSHLRKPIVLFDGTIVPTNAIVFTLSGSGQSKDKCLNAVRKSLSIAYSDLESQRKGFAEEKAKNMAIASGENRNDWKKFYREPKPLQSGLGTVEGLIDHFRDISENPLGAGSIMSSEIGSDIQTNGAIMDIIKTISVAYDLGNIPAKIVKSAENQTGTVSGLPVNALLFGSEEALLYNNDIKSKFKLMFSTQLARRSIFSFIPEKVKRKEITDLEQFYARKEEQRKTVVAAQEELNNFTSNLVESTTQEPLALTDEANKLFDIYMEYNAILSDTISNKYPIAKISRRHKQWLALKLSGNYAILAGKEEIDEKTYASAVNTVEYLANDLQKFEVELIKEPYEQLADLCRSQAEDGEFTISLHDLRKMGYISGTGSSKNKIIDLVALVNSYDKNANYTPDIDSITYKENIKTDIVGVSFKIFNNV